MRRAALAGILLLASLAGASQAAPVPDIAGVGVRKTIHGEAYTDPRGMTLYARTEAGACAADCLAGFQPFAAARLAKPVGDWTIVTGADGARQWAYRGKALFTSARDFRPGDINGEAERGWQALVPERNPVPPEVAIGRTDFGPTFVRASDRMTLYMPIRYRWNGAEDVASRHRGEGPGPEACTGDCLKDWAPLLAPAGATPTGDWTLVTREAGQRQWAWRSHPLFTRTSDRQPGDISGEGNWQLDGVEGLSWEVANLQ